MSRIVFCWELGANYGHLGRLAPVAARLEAEGHRLLFAVKDLAVATELLPATRAPIVQAPRAPEQGRLRGQPVSYAEMLATVGYADADSIAAVIRGWLDLFRLFRADAILADHSPGALLAARVAGLPVVEVALGFLRPPNVSPVPSILPAREIPQARLERAEAQVLERINRALRRHRAAPLARLADLFRVDAPILLTFEELDHYPQRTGERYSGALSDPNLGDERAWPRREGPRVLAYLRKGANLEPALDAVAAIGANAICLVPQAAEDLIRRYRAKGLEIVSSPVRVSSLLQEADATVGHASHGFTADSLLAGVPCAVLPNHAEQAMIARRVTSQGLGLAMSKADPADALRRVLSDASFRANARAFAERYESHRHDAVIAEIAATLARVASDGNVRKLGTRE